MMVWQGAHDGVSQDCAGGFGMCLSKTQRRSIDDRKAKEVPVLVVGGGLDQASIFDSCPKAPGTTIVHT